mmetsp:Transcript_17075/g.25493  ORF Transcript_17075/g.25493 Transcript_17075/m.25493 type:complete len:396 (-) Transcript_17075:197-1384(-)
MIANSDSAISDYNVHCNSQDCSKSNASSSCLSYTTTNTKTVVVVSSSLLSTSPTNTIAPELVYESLNSSMHDDHDSDHTCTIRFDTKDTGSSLMMSEPEEQPCISSSSIATSTTTASVSTSASALTSTTSTCTPQTQIPKNNPNCDACPNCEDVCCTNYQEECLRCSSKIAHFRRLSMYRRRQQLLQEQERQQQRQSFPFFPLLQFTTKTKSKSKSNAPKRTKIHHHLDHSIHHHSRIHNNSSSSSSSKNNSNCTNTKEYITMTKCQMKRYNNKQNGIYIQCNDEMIYDVTSYIDHHPGGINSILRRSGGAVDCTRDMNFHSSNAKKLWKKFHIGYLVECPGPCCHVDLDSDLDLDDHVNVDVGVDSDGDSPMEGAMGRDQKMDILDQSEQCVIS